MPTVDISEDMYRRVQEFRTVITAVMDDELDIETCLGLVFERGLNAMLLDLLGPQEHGVLLESIRQLAVKDPAVVYQYIADVLKTGAKVRERDLHRPQIGFQSQIEKESEPASTVTTR